MENKFDVKYDVVILVNDKIEHAKIELNLSRPCFLMFSYSDLTFSCTGDDYFDCFCEMRKKLKDIIFYCKGAKISVFPSRMMRDMGMGLKAYDHKIGRSATKDDEVNIFDYEDLNIVVDPDKQFSYWRKWLSSL